MIMYEFFYVAMLNSNFCDNESSNGNSEFESFGNISEGFGRHSDRMGWKRWFIRLVSF